MDYRILSKISDTLIVRTPKYVIYYVLIAPDTEISRDSPLSNSTRQCYACAYAYTRTCRVPSTKLLAVFVLPSGPTRSCQGRNEKSTSRIHGGIRLPSLQRRRDRDGQLALGLPAGKAAYNPLRQRFCSSLFSGWLPCGY